MLILFMYWWVLLEADCFMRYAQDLIRAFTFETLPGEPVCLFRLCKRNSIDCLLWVSWIGLQKAIGSFTGFGIGIRSSSC
jgi:hypothetical protein